MEKKNFYKVDVINKYSFMVSSNDDLTDEEILKLCREKSLFEDEEDSEYSSIDRLIDEYDINAFKDYTFDLDN